MIDFLEKKEYCMSIRKKRYYFNLYLHFILFYTVFEFIKLKYIKL